MTRRGFGEASGDPADGGGERVLAELAQATARRDRLRRAWSEEDRHSYGGSVWSFFRELASIGRMESQLRRAEQRVAILRAKAGVAPETPDLSSVPQAVLNADTSLATELAQQAIARLQARLGESFEVTVNERGSWHISGLGMYRGHGMGGRPFRVGKDMVVHGEIADLDGQLELFASAVQNFVSRTYSRPWPSVSSAPFVEVTDDRIYVAYLDAESKEAELVLIDFPLRPTTTQS